MTRGRARRGGILLLLVLLAAGPRDGWGEGLRVLSVRVEGAIRSGADSVLRAMETREGKEFDPDRLREDVKAIWKLGYFSDVKVDAEQSPGGVRLTVLVAEKPLVSRVAIEGNREVDSADLKEALLIRERSLFQEEKVKESVRKLLEVFRNKGFYDATVSSLVEEQPDGTLRILFRVAEGEKLSVETIRIEGNQYFDEKAIRKSMETDEKGFWSFLTDSGVFKKDQLENDVRRIEALYQNEGFLDSKVLDPEIRRGTEGLEVTIRVIEGKQYRIGEVRFRGETGMTEEELRRKARLAPGALASRERLMADVLSLTTALNDRGYAQAIVTPQVDKRRDYPLADVTYRLDQGEKFRFGKVEVTGNTKTYDRVVRRYLEVSDGMTYTATGLRESKEGLMRSSFFKDVKITTAPSKQKGEMDVRVEVVEGPTGTLSGGLGFSSIDKLFGVVQVNEMNFFGYGWKTSLNAQFGTSRRVFSLDFRDPSFLDTDLSLQLSAYNTETEYTDFDRKSKGGKIGVGYPLSKFVSNSLAFRIDSTTVNQGDDDVQSEFLKDQLSKGRQRTQSLTYTISRTTTDRYLDPSRGSILSGTVEYAGGPLGGDTDFVKYFLSAKAYRPVGGFAVLSGNLLWGHAVSTTDDPVPLSERFFLGGPYSIRGFESRTISPVDPNTGEEIGGNKELVANLELVVPLFNEIGFKGVLFVDAGNSWSQGEWPWDMKPWNGSPMKYGAGFGIRWYSPMGPLRFEWAWNLDPDPGEKKRVAEFTIGTAF